MTSLLEIEDAVELWVCTQNDLTDLGGLLFSGVASYTGTTNRSGSNGMSSTSSASTFLEGFLERGVDRAGTVTRTL